MNINKLLRKKRSLLKRKQLGNFLPYMERNLELLEKQILNFKPIFISKMPLFLRDNENNIILNENGLPTFIGMTKGNIAIKEFVDGKIIYQSWRLT